MPPSTVHYNVFLDDEYDSSAVDDTTTAVLIAVDDDDDDDDDDFDQHEQYDAFDDEYDDSDHFEKFTPGRRRTAGPRLVTEGKSGRKSVADLLELDEPDADQPDDDAAAVADVRYTSWDAASHGPDPIPEWVVTALAAIDTPLGVLKTGKEADVSLLDRTVPGGQSSLLAVKTYRSSDHRMFHRDSGYQEGRRVRRSRETRAMATRTAFGRELLAGKWAMAEFEALSRLWSAGANVPYPVQLLGSELMMEFIGEPDGSAAPRLAAAVPDGDPVDYWTHLWHDLLDSLSLLADLGFTHGDLSPYNVLVHDEHCVLIDLPQVVDIVGNPQGVRFLARDVANVSDFFSRHGVADIDPELVTAALIDRAGL